MLVLHLSLKQLFVSCYFSENILIKVRSIFINIEEERLSNFSEYELGMADSGRKKSSMMDLEEI